MGRGKRHRAVLFSALKGITALFSTTVPLMHIPADSEQEVALISSICSIFIFLVEDTDEREISRKHSRRNSRRR